MWAVILLVSTYVATMQALGICPVIILDNGLLDNLTLTQNKPLRVTEKQEFESMLSKADQLSSTMLFFIDESFSLEDFHDYDDTGAEAFPLIRRNIKRKKNKIFLNVLNAHELIKQKFVRKPENTIYLEQNEVLNIEKDMPQKYFYVYFNKIENIPQMLVFRDHEKTIIDILEKNDIRRGPIIAIYTGKWNPMELKESIQYKPIGRAGISSGKLNKDGTIPSDKSGRTEFVYDIDCGKLVISFKDPVFVNENTNSYVRVNPKPGYTYDPFIWGHDRHKNKQVYCSQMFKNYALNYKISHRVALVINFEFGKGENKCSVIYTLLADRKCGDHEWSIKYKDESRSDHHDDDWVNFRNEEYKKYDWKPDQIGDQDLKDAPFPGTVAKKCDGYTLLRLYDFKFKCHANKTNMGLWIFSEQVELDQKELVHPTRNLLTSPAIIMGLLVSFLLLGVLGFAINMILSIQTPSILLLKPAAASTEYARRVIVNNQRTQREMYNLPLTKRSLERQQLINEQLKFAEVSDDSDEQ